MTQMLKIVKEGLEDLIYPHVCISCGENLSENDRYLCPFCLNEKFKDPNPFRKISCGNIILPEKVRFQDALWKFDKGGYVQKILHAVKYHGITKLGEELGQLLGMRLSKHPLFLEYENNHDVSILPVPLHKLKFKKRGYNQARLIANGIRKATGIPVIKSEKIIRVKNTKTQTGFTLQQRLKNVKSAFKVLEIKAVSGKKLIIVDDVFTTGSTSFELASVCKQANADSVIILTVAQA
ncbi:MAG TPA: hypothetical protein VE912_07645 [Bacteroidales bacterium]|nr:hypothetical protein [Bacteroidales bacterium]